MTTRTKSSGKTTIKIPTPLYHRLGALIEGAGYNSVTDFVVYVLRDLAGERELERARSRSGEAPASAADAETQEPTWAKDLERTKRKLRGLGYL